MGLRGLESGFSEVGGEKGGRERRKRGKGKDSQGGSKSSPATT